MGSADSGRWLEDALLQLCSRVESGLQLEADVISGLVSFCEFASPEDAKEYLTNIIGQAASRDIVDEYLQKRCPMENACNLQSVPKEDVQVYMKPSKDNMQAYVKPPAEEFWSIGNRKATKISEERNLGVVKQEVKVPVETANAKDGPKVKSNGTRRKKGAKVISLAEAAKGAIVFERGRPCDCQARRHKLVNNCLSCGKIVCEQEGEGPCNFCGALVLREGSNYAGLDEAAFPLSEAEAAAEAYKNRLVDYDRNAAERTHVIDDQSDYYEFEGNTWISEEEKQLLRSKREEVEEAERARRNKVIVTLDLVGRKVVMTEEEAAQLETHSSILRPGSNFEERVSSRMKANPNISEHPVFVDIQNSMNGKRVIPQKPKKPVRPPSSVCREVSGRVQHDDPLIEVISSPIAKFVQTSLDIFWQKPKVRTQSCELEDESIECPN